MIEGHDIICFAPTDWWSMNPSCTVHIMTTLGQKNRVLYINPFSSDLMGGGATKLGTRVLRKARSIARCVRKAAPGVYAFSPVFLPLQGRRPIDAANNWLLGAQIRMVSRLLGMSRPILWMENVRAADLLDAFQPRGIVYHVSDLFEECYYTRNKEAVRERERRITDRSDLLICTSKRLCDIKAAQRDRVFYVPHGVHFERFRAAAQNGTEGAPELAHIPHPIAGYYGTLTVHNDVDLLEHCARTQPEVSFVLVGQVTSGDFERLTALKNVHLIGKVPYDRIPAICATFDVCMMYWQMDAWIQYCNPLKLLEYMASGRPVVSCPIDEVVSRYSDVVSTGGTKEEFCKAIEWELKNDTPERAARRIALAGEHDWSHTVERISQHISENIPLT